MRRYIVTGPGFTQTITACGFRDALRKVAQLYRINPLLLCVELA